MTAQTATATLVRYERTIEKYERMADTLRATVGGQTDDPEHLLDVLVAAWEEMHREAATTKGAVTGPEVNAAWETWLKLRRTLGVHVAMRRVLQTFISNRAGGQHAAPPSLRTDAPKEGH